MKRAHISLVCLLVLSMVVIPYKAFAFFGVEAAVGYWRQAPSGTLQYKGDSLNLQNDLNLGDNNQVVARVKVELPLVLPNIYVMATPMSFEGTGSQDIQLSPTAIKPSMPMFRFIQHSRWTTMIWHSIIRFLF